jgi:hypothetical protein
MSLRVVYVHGLESGPSAGKAVRLREGGLDVLAPALDTSMERLARGEGAAMLAESADRAVAAIEAHRPDVVVGSSFGGAVVHALLGSGRWAGPTVLLCPAWRRVPGAPLLGPCRSLVVVHAPNDEVVPYADSVDLAAATGATLVTTGDDDDHRLSRSATAANLAAWVRLAAGQPG